MGKQPLEVHNSFDSSCNISDADLVFAVQERPAVKDPANEDTYVHQKTAQRPMGKQPLEVHNSFDSSCNISDADFAMQERSAVVKDPVNEETYVHQETERSGSEAPG